jgi:hypothetical protein
MAFGRSREFESDQARSIRNVTLIALSSVTHGFNMGQRINRLAFSQASGGLNITAPSSANTTPPGYYMLFILNGSAVPSVAKIARINGTATPTPTPTATPTATPQPSPTTTPTAVAAAGAPTNLTASATSASAVKLLWKDNSDNEGGFRIDRSLNGAAFTKVATVGTDITGYSDSGLATSKTYCYRVSAFNSGGSSTNSIPQRWR